MRAKIPRSLPNSCWFPKKRTNEDSDMLSWLLPEGPELMKSHPLSGGPAQDLRAGSSALLKGRFWNLDVKKIHWHSGIRVSRDAL